MAVPRSATVDPALRGELIDLLASSPQVPQPEPTGQTMRIPDSLDVRCVLLDVYGTLFVSASGDVGSAQSSSRAGNFTAAVEKAGFAILDATASVEAEHLYFEGIRKCHEAARADGVDFPEVDIAEIWANLLASLVEDRLLALRSANNGVQESMDHAAAVAATTYEVLSNPVAPMPGMQRTISELSGSDIYLGIVSNAQFYTPLLFPAFLGQTHTELGFRDELCAWSFSSGRAKPSVSLFAPPLEQLGRRGIEPRSVLYVGNDMLNDVWTAKEAGCRTALFAGDRRSLRLRTDDPRCAELEPDLVILSLPDLLRPLGLGSTNDKKGSPR